MTSLKFIQKQIWFIFYLLKNTKSANFWISYSNFSHFPTWVASGFRASKIILDSVEMPDPSYRTSPYIRKLHPTLKFFLKSMDRFIGKRAYKITTTCSTMKTYLEAWYGREVEYLLNYDPTPFVHDVKKIPFSIAIPSSVTQPTGLDFIVNVMQKIPEHWTVKFIGQSEKEMDIIKNRLSHRPQTFFYPTMSNKDYLSEIATCEIGWILFDIRIPNCYYLLPNRYLDMKKFNLPIIHTGNLGIQYYQLKNDFVIPYGESDLLIEQTKKLFKSPPILDVLKIDGTSWDKILTPIKNQKINIVSFNNFNYRCRLKLLNIQLESMGSIPLFYFKNLNKNPRFE